MGQIQSLEDLIGLILRRFLLVSVVTVLGAVMTLFYAISKRDVFESTAVIQVHTPSVTSLETAVARENSAQRLQAIQQQLTTRESMLAVIERHGLYVDLPISDDQKAQLLRMSVRFETVASASSTGFGPPTEIAALMISAQADSRATAARIANDFAQGVLDAGSSGQMERALEALDIFQEEARGLKAEIDTKEASIAQFQAQNTGALPAQREVLRSELTGLETELRKLNQALVAARNERAAIERKGTLRATDRRQLDTLAAQIETLAAQGTALDARRAEITKILASAQNVDRTIAEYERDLTRLQTQYATVARSISDAETAAKMQDMQKGETFSILERAVEPDYPISGGRRKLVIVGVAGSFLAGIFAAFVLDHLNPVLRTQRQLERELDMRAIVAIPQVNKDGQPAHKGFAQEISSLSDLTRRMPEIAAKIKVAKETSGPITKLSSTQTLATGSAVILLLVVAIALT